MRVRYAKLEFRAASSSDAVKPTPSARIGFGQALWHRGQLPDLRPVDLLVVALLSGWVLPRNTS